MTNSNDNNERGPDLPRGVTLGADGKTLFLDGIPLDSMIALPLHIAARLARVTRQTMWRAIAAGKLRVNGRRVLRSELERWLSGAELPKRRGRPRKTEVPRKSPTAEA